LRERNRPISRWASGAADLQAYVWVDQIFPISSSRFCRHSITRSVPQTLASLWPRILRISGISNLAIAIAVVYDMPPPQIWPHRQVTQQALQRGLLEHRRFQLLRQVRRTGRPAAAAKTARAELSFVELPAQT